MSDLVGNPEDRFSRVEAHMISVAEQLSLHHTSETTKADFLMTRVIGIMECINKIFTV